MNMFQYFGTPFWNAISLLKCPSLSASLKTYPKQGTRCVKGYADTWIPSRHPISWIFSCDGISTISGRLSNYTGSNSVISSLNGRNVADTSKAASIYFLIPTGPKTSTIGCSLFFIEHIANRPGIPKLEMESILEIRWRDRSSRTTYEHIAGLIPVYGLPMISVQMGDENFVYPGKGYSVYNIALLSLEELVLCPFSAVD